MEARDVAPRPLVPRTAAVALLQMPTCRGRGVQKVGLKTAQNFKIQLVFFLLLRQTTAAKGHVWDESTPVGTFQHGPQ